MNKWLIWSCTASFLAVAIGAFGAHALSDRLTDTGLTDTFETGVQYHMMHALGLAVLAFAADKLGKSVKLIWAARLMAAGIVIFSGSLYVLSLSGVKWLGAITPIGGVCFLTAWLLLGIASFNKKN